jgi:CheY-like chemotaxis protein
MQGTKPPSLVFLVDDDLDDQMLFRDAIVEINPAIEVGTAVNGVQALQILTQEPKPKPDYIFIDLNMPLMNGIQCLKEIKAIPDLQNIPVIIYSTSSYEKDMQQTAENGAFYYIVKPFSFQELCERIKTVLEMPIS